MNPDADGTGKDEPGQARQSAARWPSPSVAWLGVAMLMIAAVFSLVDRQVLSLLVDPMRSSLGLTDVQIAVLQGPAFMVSYTLLGFPLGWLVDRTHRIRLVAAGIALWSVACAACGLMHSFETLAIARMFVGIGEAVLAPATVSLVADYFPPARRAFAMSIQSAASTTGIGFAMLAGGTVIALARSQPEVSVLGFESLDTWRFVFIACGVPGLAFAALLLLTPEPARQERSLQPSLEARLLPFVRAARGWILSHFAAISATAIVAYGFMGWAPTYLVRRHQWPITDAAFLLGSLFAILGTAGSIGAGWWVRRRRERGEVDAALRVCRVAAVGLTVSIGAFALNPGPALTVALLAVAVFSIAMAPGISAAALQEVTPNALRGRVSAMYYIFTNLVGASLGPVVAAVVSQKIFGDPMQIGLALATIALVGGPLTALLLTVALKPFRELAQGSMRSI